MENHLAMHLPPVNCTSVSYYTLQCHWVCLHARTWTNCISLNMPIQSPTTQDTFLLIPSLITCAWVTGRWDWGLLLIHRMQAYSFVAARLAEWKHASAGNLAWKMIRFLLLTSTQNSSIQQTKTVSQIYIHIRNHISKDRNFWNTQYIHISD